MKLIKETGKKFIYGSYKKCALFVCPLCGNEVERPLHSGLRQKSCSCYEHGGKQTRIYSVWKSMRNRCNYKKDDSFCRYGAKGIKVCDEWNSSFVKFRDWADQNGYSDDLQIDRIDANKGYSPENCRWVTPAENARNRKTTKLSMEKANKIREIYRKGGVSQSKIAEKFGTWQQTVWLIVNNKLWVDQKINKNV